jgi:hypothetical protein
MYPGSGIEFLLPVINMCTLLSGTVFTTFYGHRLGRVESRVAWTVAMLLICMFTVPLLNVAFMRGYLGT